MGFKDIVLSLQLCTISFKVQAEPISLCILLNPSNFISHLVKDAVGVEGIPSYVNEVYKFSFLKEVSLIPRKDCGEIMT